jgi:hypothetical protein
MHDTADHAAIIHPLLAAHVRRQVRLNLTPLLVAQPKQVAPHLLCLPNHGHRESSTDSAINAFIGF